MFFFGNLFRCEVAAGPIVAEGLFGGKRRLSFGVKSFFRTEAFVGLTFSQESLGRGDMLTGKVRLEIRALIVGDSEPFKSLQNTSDGFIGGAFGIGVFDAQYEFAARLFSIKPIIEGCASPADM